MTARQWVCIAVLSPSAAAGLTHRRPDALLHLPAQLPGGHALVQQHAEAVDRAVFDQIYRTAGLRIAARSPSVLQRPRHAG